MYIDHRIVGMSTDARLPVASSALQRLVMVWGNISLVKEVKIHGANLVLSVEVEATDNKNMLRASYSAHKGRCLPLPVERDVTKEAGLEYRNSH